MIIKNNKNKYLFYIQKQLFKFAVVLIVISMFVNIFTINQTYAYFNDEATIEGSTFTAGTLAFHLNPETYFNSILTKGGSSSPLSADIVNDGSIDFQYSISTTDMTGDDNLCNYLSLNASLNNTSVYTGYLSTFVSIPRNYSNPTNWSFVVTLPDEAEDTLQDKTCSFKFTFKSWQEGLSPTEGFSDTKQISATVSSDNWTVTPPAVSGVVLNEFLPRPEGEDYGFNFGNDSSDMPQGEWVELYNNGDTDENVTGWYLADNTNGNGNVTPINTSHILVSSPIVPTHGWLVVYMNKSIYNNTGDTVRLFNASGSLVDSYSYGDNSTSCDIKPTPNDDNDANAFGNCNDSNIPGNKSFARIPDGTGNWVDPIPTPGEINKVDEVILNNLDSEVNEVIAPIEEVVIEELVAEELIIEKLPEELSQIFVEEPVKKEDEQEIIIEEVKDDIIVEDINSKDEEESIEEIDNTPNE